MPPQRGGRPVNQTVANNFQQIIVSGRRDTVQCLHCRQQMVKEASRQQSHLNQCNTLLNSIIDGQVLLKLPLHDEGVNLQAN